MQYIIEAFRQVFPGLGCGFLIYSLVRHFAQPWWTMGVIFCVIGVVLNFKLIPIPSQLRARNKVMHTLEKAMPILTLALVLITLVVSLLR